MNGESVSGKSYAEVVALIQRLRDNLSLIVVPKQDDILQMVIGVGGWPAPWGPGYKKR